MDTVRTDTPAEHRNGLLSHTHIPGTCCHTHTVESVVLLLCHDRKATTTTAMVRSVHIATTTPVCLGMSAKSSKRLRKRRLRRVGFADSSNNKVYIVPPTEHTWYTLDEYAVFENDVRTTVRKLRAKRRHECHDDDDKDENYCPRGLEKYQSLRHHEEKKIRERSHYGAIFREQYRQLLEGTHNPNILRTLSRIHSKWSRHNAIEVASRDAQEVLVDPIHEDFFKVALDALGDLGALEDLDDISVSSNPISL